LPGENADIDSLPNPEQAALDLAGFILALQRIDPRGEPVPDAYNARRGEPLANRDRLTRECIFKIRDEFDTIMLTAIWESALQAPAWSEPPVWLYGDLQSGNRLAVRGKLSAVIDFGCMGVGDPAYDLMAAWLYLNAASRKVFRRTLQADRAAWLRNRGLALSVSVAALPYYRLTNPTLSGITRKTIREVLLDFRVSD